MMIAASNAYLHGKNEAETAYRLITEGFVGTLRNWWDHLPKEAKAEIEASVRTPCRSPGQLRPITLPARRDRIVMVLLNINIVLEST